MSSSENNTANKTVRLFAGLLSVLIAFTLVAGVVKLIRGDSKSDEVSWLFSQSADSSQIENASDGNTYITLRGVDTHTVQFSDRPDRIAKVIETSKLVNEWSSIFADSSPNAVLVEHDANGEADSLVVELEKPVFNYAKDELTYKVRVLADEEHPERLKKLAHSYKTVPAATRAVSLFIDNALFHGPSGPPAFEGPAAAALKNKFGLSNIPSSPFNMGDGVQIVSAHASQDANGVVTAEATVGFHDGSFQLNMHLDITDKNNWTLTAKTAASTPWTPAAVPGLTIDPSSFTGTITRTNGVNAYSLTGATHTWQITSGVTYVSTPSFTSNCPLDSTKCVNFAGPYLSMNGTLSSASFPNNISLTGAMLTDASWIRFDGTTGDITLAALTGSSVKVTSPTVTLWKGLRNDSFDPNMQLPSLAKLNGGVDLQFCGGFSITIPKVTNKATSGCVSFSPSGVVIGQVGVEASMSGTMPSTGSVASATATVKGIALTNIADNLLSSLPSRNAIMSGVSNAVQNQKITIAGKAELPSVVADALNLKISTTTLSVPVTGVVSATSLSLSADINVDINLGKEPFKLNLQQITATINATSGNGASFTLGTSSNAVVGYSPNTRTLQTSVSLVAATSPNTGMSLSLNVRGTPSSADANVDGLTTSTRLTDPANAQFVWPDQFGIKGLNLWNLTVQVAFTDGSPALGYTSTSYMDPNGANTGKVLSCTGTCDGADWMVGTLGFNISYTNPCFAYSFNSSSGTSAFSVDHGAMKATKFAIGIAPDGCSIQSGSTQQELPVAYAGFDFSVTFGDTSVEVATQLKDGEFVFNETISNLTFAGVKYTTVNLSVVISEKKSNVSFGADMSSDMGKMTVTAGFSADTKGLTQTLDATLTDWKWTNFSGSTATKDGVDLTSFHFKDTTDIPDPSVNGCASFDASADGAMTIGSNSYTMPAASIGLNCHGIQKLKLQVSYEHTPKWGHGDTTVALNFNYPATSSGDDWTSGSGTKYFYGSAGFDYSRSFSDKYKDKRFDADVDVSFEMSISYDPTSPLNSTFEFAGKFDANRVSGDISGEMDDDGGDFTCSGELRLNPSWAGVYHATWNDL